MDNMNYKIHLFYWAIIFILLAVFLVLCVPGRINEEAFSNFSFASVLISIVLAVISIVLSIRVGQSTNQYYGGIREIEKDIDSKLSQFEDLDNSIRNSVKGIITEEVKDVKESQNRMTSKVDSLLSFTKVMESFSSTNNINKGTDSSMDLSSSSNLTIAALYIACIMYENDSPFPFKSFSTQASGLILGFLSALRYVYPDSIRFNLNKDLKISFFSSEKWGDSKHLKQYVNNIDNQEIKGEVLNAEKCIICSE